MHRNAMQWGRGVVRFRYRGRRSEIGGRRTRNDGRRRAGEAEREVGGCSLGMINTTRTPSSHESSEDGSRSTRNWTFSICKSDEKLVRRGGGGGGCIKWFPVYWCLASAFLVSRCMSQLLGFPRWDFSFPIFVGQQTRIAIQKNSCRHLAYHGIMEKIRLPVWNSYFHKSARVQKQIRNFSILLHAQFSPDYFYISDNDRSLRLFYTSEAINFIL